jgi:hypothetical protein
VTPRDLIPLFDKLEPAQPAPGGVPAFAVCEIPGHRQKLGKDSDGQPVFLLRADGDREAPIALEHLSIKHGVRCRIHRGAEVAEEDRFTIVQCVRGDRTMHTYFLRAVGSVVLSLGDDAAGPAVSSAMGTLVNLFRAMSRPPRKAIQGLWAELFVIAGSTDPSALIDAWHAVNGELYDFSAGPTRIEVKSCVERSRNHYFRLEQVRPPAGVTAVIASVMVQPLGGGASAHELLQEIRARVSPADRVLTVERLVAEALGSDWATAVSSRFDRQLATESLMFFDARSVPAPPSDLPDGVSEVRFRSRLEGLLAANHGELRATSALFAAVLA